MKRLWPWLKDQAPAVCATLAGFVFIFQDALFRGCFVLVGDPLRQLYPLRMVVWEMIRNGVPPLWTPHILSGYPLSAMVMLGITYPLTWGYLFLPGHHAEQIYIAAPYLLAPLFTYAFLRELGRSRSASILGGLTFGYGGFLFSTIGLTGVHVNSALWLPLLLLGIDRARRRAVQGLLIATFAFAMSVLAGSGQMFLYAGGLGLAYGIFVALFPSGAERRWPPVLVAFGAILFGAGLTAYQIAETWVATGLSVRRAYPPERFAEGSYPVRFALESLVQPLQNYWDSTTYVAAVAVVFALIAIAAALITRKEAAQTSFWLVAAAVAFVLILGNNTPLFELYSRIPFVSRFRYPSRHTLQWSFSIAVLASIGFDLVAARMRALEKQFLAAAGGVVLTIVACIVATRWSAEIVASGLDQFADLNNTIRGLNGGYVALKIAFVAALIAAMFFFLKGRKGVVQEWLIAAAIVVACVVEPFFWLVRPIIRPSSVPASQFNAVARSTQILRNEVGPHPRIYEDRVFSAAHPYTVSLPGQVLEAPNWTALAGLHEANGYESLILERYSEALRGFVDPEPWIGFDPALVDLRSHVLDLLNVRYVTSFSDFGAAPAQPLVKDGVAFTARDLGLDLSRDKLLTMSALDAEADTLVMVSTMANSGGVTDGTPVARATLHLADGRAVELFVRAGLHTAEWAHERPDVRSTVKHRLATVFDSAPGDQQASFQSHRFIGRLPIGERARIDRIDLLKLVPDASVGIWKLSLHDSVSGASTTLPRPSPERWRTVHEENGVVITENRRALPRAWLVPHVEMLEPREILRRIRGESDVPFDPRLTALIEKGTDVPKPGTSIGNASVRIVDYEANRIALESVTSAPAFLVISEHDYPGWVATVDGVETPLLRTNYLLRGLVVPAGQHDVELRYGAPAARRGAVISVTTLILLVAIALRSARARRHAAT